MTENMQEESAGPGSKALWMGCQDELSQVIEQSGSMYELAMRMSQYFEQRHLTRPVPEDAQLNLVLGVFAGPESVMLRYIDAESGMVFSVEPQIADRQHENVKATMEQMTHEREMHLTFVLCSMYEFPGFASLNQEMFVGFGDPGWLKMSDAQLSELDELEQVIAQAEQTRDVAHDFVFNEDERMEQMVQLTEQADAQQVSATKLLAKQQAAEQMQAQREAKEQP